MPSLDASYDVVIVGAGAASLAAAKTVQAQGRRVLVVEAKDRIGGRAYTNTATLGVPFDHGCSWLHSASRNPFVGIARDLGFTVEQEERPRRIHSDGRWAATAEVADWQTYADTSFEAMTTAAAEGRDVAAAEVIDRRSRWAGLFDAWLGMVSGVNAEDASTLDHAQYVDTGENWPVREGYGALVACYGSRVPVKLSCRVERVAWGDRVVRLATASGVVSAKAAILTVSTGVLASGSIRFDPPLPDWTQAAIDAVPMGAANKIAVRFDRDVFGTPLGGYSLFSSAKDDAISFQIRPFGWPVAVGYVGGRFCRALERAGPGAGIACVLDRLSDIFGSDLRRHVQSAVCTAWQSDSDVLGAYSAARPGMAHRRSDLARPLDDRLFFAGEATSVAFYSTAHGALLSGIAAAEAAIAAITE